jgi:hypothetical protein
MSSEIFDEYARIALDKGLIKEAAEEETNPRYDSHDLSAIQMLYDVKPNGEDDDILDKAHPEPVVIAPSYDRFNGLVEDLKQQHDMMCYIALKPNDGKLTHHRYVKANSDLVDELTRIAFLLDKNGQEDLMCLADNCTSSLVKSGTVLGGIGIAVLVGAAALAGLAYTQNYPPVQGVVQNSESTITEIREAIEDDPELAPELTSVISKIEVLKDAAEKVLDIKIMGDVNSDDDAAPTEGDVLQNTQTGRTIKKIIKVTEGMQDGALKKIEIYRKICKLMQKYLGRSVAAMRAKESKFMDDLPDWAAWGRDAFRGVIPSDYRDAYLAMESLSKAISESLKHTENIEKMSKTVDDEQELTNQLNALYNELNSGLSERIEEKKSADEKPAEKPAEEKPAADKTEEEVMKLFED